MIISFVRFIVIYNYQPTAVMSSPQKMRRTKKKDLTIYGHIYPRTIYRRVLFSKTYANKCHAILTCPFRKLKFPFNK